MMCRDDPPLVKRVPPFVDAKNSTSSSKYATASSGSAIFKRTIRTKLVVLFGKNAPPHYDTPTPTVLPLPKAALINPPKVFRDDDDIIIIVFFFDGDSGGIEEEKLLLLLFANAVALEDALSMQSSSGGASSSSALVVVASLMIDIARDWINFCVLEDTPQHKTLNYNSTFLFMRR